MAGITPEPSAEQVARRLTKVHESFAAAGTAVRDALGWLDDADQAFLRANANAIHELLSAIGDDLERAHRTLDSAAAETTDELTAARAWGKEGWRHAGGSDLRNAGTSRPRRARVNPLAPLTRRAEQATALRLADNPDFDGRVFSGVPPPDPGHDWVDDLGRTYDALGDGTTAKYLDLERFTQSIDHHLNKGNDFTVIDATGYSRKQVLKITEYVDSLPPEKQRTIVRVGF